MNTQNTKPSLTFKKSVTTITGRVDIELKLADDCNNGHADFSITGRLWEKAQNGRMVDIAGGCIHEEILEAWPAAAPFIALHLCDSNGAPMYAVENGFCHMHNMENTPSRRREIAREHFRTTEVNLDVLFTAEDQDHLRFLLEKLGIVEKWKDEARAAISTLESLTGKSWDYTYAWPRSQYTPLKKEEKDVIMERIEEGYYTPEACAARKEAARVAAIEKKRAEIKADCEGTVGKAQKEAALLLWLLDKTEELKRSDGNFLFDMDMVIYYDHSDTLSFNWRGYGPRFTKENFDIFAASVNDADRAVLPSGLKFELK